MFVTIFLDNYENPRRKNFINLSCTKHPKRINWNKKRLKYLFSHFFVVPQKVKKKCENKKYMSFPLLIREWDDKC